MQSRVSIHVDHDNQPVIKVEFLRTGDVRDTLVERFLDSFGSSSQWATVLFENPERNKGVINSAIIRPIHPTDLPREVEAMRAEADLQQKALDNVNKQFPSHE